MSDDLHKESMTISIPSPLGAAWHRIEVCLKAIEEHLKPRELIAAELVPVVALNNEELAEQVAARVLARIAKPPLCPIHPVPDDPVAHTIEALSTASEALNKAVKDWGLKDDIAQEISEGWNKAMFQIVERVKRKAWNRGEVETQPQ